MLVISRKCGQSFHIGDNIRITITEVSGDKIKIGIEAPRELSILRDELIQIIDTNKAAVAKADSAAMHNLAAGLKRLELPKTKTAEKQ